ncbi:MAG: DUF4347 domain-containing protein [Nodosilinea sp.]
MYQTPQSVVFIDANVSDVQHLLNGVLPGVAVKVLAPDVGGIAQITDYLRAYPADTVHIVSHGAPGVLFLGNTQLNLTNLETHAQALQSWFSPQISNPTLLLYGCNVAAGDAGEEFIAKLHHLTGAVIAASNTPIGSAALGGQWQLPIQVGFANSVLAFNTEAMETYSHVLELPAPRSAQVGNEVFLGGSFIELGINSGGAFGSQSAKPSGFFGTTQRSNVGMSVDLDGFATGTVGSGDYFLPGDPEERWAIGYQVNGNTVTASNGKNTNAITTTVTDTSVGDSLAATVTGTHSSTLQINQEYSLKSGDKFFKTTVTLTNASTTDTLDGVRYMRSFDPDNPRDFGGNSSTVNTVQATIAEDGYALVEAKAGPTDPAVAATGTEVPVFFYSEDPRAVASYFGFANTNPYDSAAYGAPPAKGVSSTADIGITMTFDVGSLAPGASTTMVFYTSLDPRPFSEVIGGLSSIPDLEDASDTGLSTTDNVTSDTTPTFVGSLDSSASGETIKIYANAVLVGSSTVQSDGSWSVTASSLLDGDYAITSTRTGSGAEGEPSSPLNVTIDTTPPSTPPSAPDLTAASDNGASNTDNITSLTTPTFAGTLTAAETGFLVKIFDGATEVGQGTVQSDGSWSVETSTLEFGNRSISYSLTDLAGNESSLSSPLAVTIEPPDQPPVLTLPTAGIALDDGNSTVVSADLTLADADGGTIDGAKVSIGTGFKAGEDALGILGQTGSSGTVEGLGWDYNSSTGILTLTGSASAETYQTALRQVTFNSLSDSPTTAGARDVQFSIGSQLANPDNGHFYEFVTDPGITWTSAKTAAEGRSFFGLQGYLVTVTSTAENAFVASKLNGLGWLGASDATVEGDWRWMTGPEAGQQFWSGLSTGGPVGGNFNNWASGEPNNAGDEDYGHFLSGGDWNDYANATTVNGYVVEYGGMPGDPVLNLVGDVTVTVNSVNDSPTGTVTISGTAEQGSTLTAANTLADPDGLGAITYTWFADGSPTGVTGATYALAQADVGKVFTVQASYTDGGSTLESATSSPTSAVANVNDSPTGTVTIDGTITQGQILTANTSTLGDADGLGTLSYQWQQSTDGITFSNIDGATGVNYSPRNDQVNQFLQVAVSYVDGQGTAESLTSAPTSESVEKFGATSDFNGDGSVDIFWRHQNVGESVFWLMDNIDFAGGDFLSPVISDVNWDIKALGDLNGDGTPDLVWQNEATNQAAVWLMDGVNLTSGELLPNDAASGWKVVESGDFNDNGKDDLLWRNANTGELAVWFMDGTNFVSGEFITLNAGLDWEVGAVGDFTKDGKTDIFWENRITGANVFWEMDGTNFVSAIETTTAETIWQAKGSGDFSQDGNLDLLWHNPSTGENALWLMDGTDLVAGVTTLPTTEVSWNPVV